ncbi:helix-turn-helix transcriptional regulator [Marinicella sp. S1101]|uniref:helix-turn-helix transcriptional regulator n=1 Tax=Marinicella marina TaxID=2996016 RepID=UPI002260B6E6|nr:helix-turn-helix transcriptional regulator [Marinicella marina]MCX7553077.1 helix-turn-helix transcriptional regulator [Marinicella marina]
MINSKEIINKAMSVKGFNQQQMSNYLDKNQATVSRYCSGDTVPPLDIIMRLMHIIENEKVADSAARIAEKIKSLDETQANKELIKSFDALLGTHINFQKAGGK